MNSHSSAGPWLATGAKHLVAGEYELARTVFRRRGKVYSETGDSTPRVLAQIAGQWMQLDERGPRVFRWEKAGDLLKSSARLKGLPPALRSWLEQQSERIDLNAKALLAIAEADQLGARAAGLAKEGKLEHALETYERAAHQYESVNSKSMVSREALASSAKLGNEAFGHLTQSLREGAKAARPDWRHLQGRIEAGQRFAVDGKDRALLRRLGEACRTNLEDEGRFVDAGKLIKQQNAARFGEAKKLLEAVDPRSKIYPDALAYLEWLEADAKVRDAVSAYRRAFGKRAFELLAEAYSSSSLGAAAKESISIRRSHWVRVVRSYERGMASSHRGDKLKAMGELKRVVELEQDPTNLYRVRAKDELEDIKGTLSDQLRGRLESGLQALKRGELREAGRWFDEVNEDPIKSRRDLAMIEAAVAKRNTRERLLVKAKGQLIRDNRKEFLQLRDVFSLLARWLPARSEDRAQAEKHLKVVAARLRFWEKVAERALK
jgi:tetratricopeptide (TPR) repeat protein